MITLPEGAPTWRSVPYDLQNAGRAEGVRTLFQATISPSCTSIAERLQTTTRGPGDDAIRAWDTLLEARLELHKSFALMLGALWERHFRRHLWHSAAVILPGSKSLMTRIERGDWPKLLAAFERVRGFPLSTFPSFPELALLHEIATAVRHGNGPATERLFGLRPDLFTHKPIRSWSTYFALGGEPPDSIHKLDIPVSMLEGFASAVGDFWDQIIALQKAGKAGSSPPPPITPPRG